MGEGDQEVVYEAQCNRREEEGRMGRKWSKRMKEKEEEWREGGGERWD